MNARGSILLGFFAAILIAAIAGCGGGTAPAGGASGGKPADAGGGNDTLAKIRKAGVLKWGSDPKGGGPFVYGDPNDTKKIIGFEVDFMEAFAKHMGVQPEIAECEWDGLIPFLKNKRCDIVVNGVEINEERLKLVAFSEPYYFYEQQLTVRAEDKDKYKTLDDLKGKKIGTLNGAESNNVLKEKGFAEDLITGHKDSTTPYTNLELKRVDAVLQESIIAAHYASTNPKLHNVPQTFSMGKYGICVRLEDKELLAETARILDTMKKNGELAAIYKKWNIWNEKQKDIGIQEK